MMSSMSPLSQKDSAVRNNTFRSRLPLALLTRFVDEKQLDSGKYGCQPGNPGQKDFSDL